RISGSRRVRAARVSAQYRTRIVDIGADPRRAADAQQKHRPSMKQSLDLRLGQHLTITPQLQQAIRLLQLSTVELEQEIREALESNPLLEEAGDDLDGRDESADAPETEANGA